MERILKTFCILTVVFFVAITFGSGSDRGAYAGGGIDYTVTVSNPTDGVCKVAVYVNKVIDVPLEEVRIEPGSSHTWHTGAYCPSSLWGKYYDKVGGEWRKMQCCNPYGNRVDCVSGLGGVAVCKSVKFKVCRKVGVTEVRDYDFGFCKD